MSLFVHPIDLSILLSFRNEEEVIPELIRRLHAVLEPLKLNYEIIFINDSSTDKSLEILMAKAKQDKRIKVINMSRRFGVIECLLAGMKYSVGAAVVTMDCDLQDPPELLPEMIQKRKNGADVIYSVRKKRKGEGVLKLFLTRIAYRLVRLVSGMDLPLDAGDFKLMSRRVVDELLKWEECQPYLRGLIRYVGFKQTPIEYDREERKAGQSHFPLTSLGPYKMLLAGLTFSSGPLFFPFLAGIFLITAVLLLSLLFLVVSLVGFSSMTIFMILFMLLLGGIQLVSIGIIGVFLAKMYRQLLKRPLYIVESTIGF